MLIKKIAPFILFFITSAAMGQRNNLNKDHENFFKFGAKAGVNINKITGQSYNSGFNYNFQVGGFMQFNFSNVFGLQPEISFVQTQSEFSNDPNNIYDDLFGGGTQHKAKLDYLEVPLLLNINIGPSKRVKLQLGPAYGGLLKQTVDSLKNNGNIYKNSDLSAIGGLWIQLPFINIGARYKLGLTNINNIDDKEKWKNQAIQIFAGITF
ncbi:MAG: porin family protein [Ferruginibacter sp.]